MKIKKLKLTSSDYPEVLRELKGNKPPDQLYWAGAAPEELLKHPRVAIVGSRKISAYGRQVTMRIAGELAELGVVIISGLAFGVDCVAHQAALEAGGLAIGVLPCPIERIVPVANRRLAQTIIDKGGALVSEYGADDSTHKGNFVARNRIVSGLADAVLITEAAEKSGSLHTANFAADQGREVLVVPGNITYPSYAGSHNLIKAGARLATTYVDVLYALGLSDRQITDRKVRGRNAYEQRVLDLMMLGISEGDQLLEQSNLTTSEFNQVLTMLEIGGKIRPLGMNNWGVF